MMALTKLRRKPKSATAEVNPIFFTLILGGNVDTRRPKVQPLHHPAPGSKTKALSLACWLNLFKSQQHFSPILPQDELQHAGVTFINNRKFPREATDMSQVSLKVLKIKVIQYDIL